MPQIGAGKAKDAADKTQLVARAAREEAESFEKRIVVANNVATKAETHLAEALERTVRVEKRLTWRTVTKEQVEQIRRALAPLDPLNRSPAKGMKILVSYPSGDSEGAEYADELADALRALGAEILGPVAVIVMGSGPGGPPRGVIMQVKAANTPGAALLQQALKAAGIEASGEIHATEAPIRLMVGVKPREPAK